MLTSVVATGVFDNMSDKACEALSTLVLDNY